MTMNAHLWLEDFAAAAGFIQTSMRMIITDLHRALEIRPNFTRATKTDVEVYVRTDTVATQMNEVDRETRASGC